MRGLAALAGSALLLGGCAISQPTSDIVTGYNRTFAKTRNEMLLLNVLRSSAREPLQFSIMGQVQGAVGNGGELSIPFTNLIAGGANVISPSIRITDAVNPNVSIIPLTSKEFASGILTPIRLETIQLFVHNGWDPDFLLPLVVGAVICPTADPNKKEVLLNGGKYLEWRDGQMRPTALHVAFRNFFHSSAKTFAISSKPSDSGKTYVLTVGDKEALTALKDGVGGYGVESVEDAGPGLKRMTLKTSNITLLEGLAFDQLCGDPDKRPSRSEKGIYVTQEQAEGALGADPKGRVLFRSVGSIIHYLGESHRVRYDARTSDEQGLSYVYGDGTLKTLFKVDWGLNNAAEAVETRFHDERFFIRRLDIRHGEDDDRTLKTLSFLDQLIALQTSENAIRGTQAIIALPQ